MIFFDYIKNDSFFKQFTLKSFEKEVDEERSTEYRAFGGAVVRRRERKR